MRMRRVDLRDERGATAAFVAMGLIALIGMLSLAVDGGAMMAKRRGMVNASDAASLAAAQSCAVGAGEGEAISQADTLAASNITSAARQSISFNPACDAPFGEVTVLYQTIQELFFAPVVGVEPSKVVGANATAEWGVAGGAANVTPIELSGTQLRGCGYPDLPIGTECAFWYNNEDTTNGAASWGFMNLNHWDVDPAFNCNASGGSADLGTWIVDGYPGMLLVNDPPTYVCNTTGARAGNWQRDLESQIGKLKMFPVNDELRQVDSTGSICTPEMAATNACRLDKYFIVAFANLLITEVLAGNDPRAVGTAGGGGHCQTNPPVEFRPTPPANQYALIASGCSVANLVNLTVRRVGSGNPLLQPNVDYRFDPLTNVVTWLRSDTMRVRIEWDWSIPGTPGKCGALGVDIPRPDPNARCLVVQYMGLHVTPGPPCLPTICPDFGVRSIRLKA